MTSRLYPKTVPVPESLEIFFDGKSDPCFDVGSPHEDFNLPKKLRGKLDLGDDHTHRVLYPDCDHSGEIYRIGIDGRSPDTGRSLTCEGENRETGIFHFPGDAVVAPADYRDDMKRYLILALRTRDCIPIILYDASTNTIAAVHLSNQTEFGYDPDKPFVSPILKRVMKMLNPATTYAFIGPAIGGIKSKCNCYEYDEFPEKDKLPGKLDGSRLKQRIKSLYPTIALRGVIDTEKSPGKMIFRWGWLVLLILQFLGIPEEQIDTSCNVCTKCNPTEFYSSRDNRKMMGLNKETNRCEELRLGNLSILKVK